MSKRIISLRSTTVWRAASIEFRIERQKVYRSWARKKKMPFTSETENYFPCRSLLYAIHSFSSHFGSQYDGRFIIRRRLGRGKSSMCLSQSRKLRLLSLWVTSEFFRTDLWRISLWEDLKSFDNLLFTDVKKQNSQQKFDCFLFSSKILTTKSNIEKIKSKQQLKQAEKNV